MRRALSVVAIVVLSLALVVGVACGGGGEDGGEDGGVKELKYGYAQPMSGILGAVVGIPAKQGVQLAADSIGEFTVSGESYRWKVIFEDNYYTSAGGVATATKFIYEEGIKFMNQGGFDAPMAAQPLCEETEVMLIASGAGLELFGPDKPHTLECSPMYMVHIPAFFKWLTEQHPEIETVAIVDSDDAMGHGKVDCLVAAAEHFGLEVAIADFLPIATVEVYPIATKVMAKNPDFFVGNWTVLKAMQEMGYEGLSAYELWLSTTAEDVGFENFQGHLCYFPLHFGQGLPPALVQFGEEYEARYGQPFELCSFYPAVSLYTLTDVLQQTGTVDDMDKILATIDTGTFDTGVFGPMRFCGEELCGINRMLLWPIRIHEWRGEQPRVIFEMDPEEAYELACEVYK